MLNIVVCDDEKDCMDKAVECINKWSKETNVKVNIIQCDNGDMLLETCNQTKVDLIFLDIIMPLLNGMDTAKELRTLGNDVKIIFLTSSVEFAVESYDVKANGYLIKPVQYDRVKKALDELSNEVEEEYIIVKVHNGYQKINLNTIECVEAQGKQTKIYTLLEACLVSEPFHHFEEKLTLEKGFFKCHRSYIVSIPNIDRFNNVEVYTKSQIHIPISRGKGKELKENYFNVMFGDQND